jgi:hypothetical protein
LQGHVNDHVLLPAHVSGGADALQDRVRCDAVALRRSLRVQEE